MFSSTTIALSMPMPTANVSPAMLITFSDRPAIDMPKNVPTMLTGTATSTTIVAPTLRSVTSSTRPASSAPAIRFVVACCRASSM